MINTEYLDARHEVANKFNVELETDERVIFAFILDILGNEKGSLLGRDSKITITNRRMILNNSFGIDLADDIVSFHKVNYGKFIFKGYYYSLDLNKEVIYDYGKQKLTAFQFYFNKKQIKEELEFEEIMNKLFN